MQSAVAVAVLGVVLGGCSARTPDPISASPSTPAATATDTASPRPTGAEPLPTETAEPLTPTKPTQPAATTSAPNPSATADPGSVSGDCSRTLPAYPVLSPGDRGRAVRAVQCFLNDADFGPVAVDGVYGAQTRAAMKRLEATYEGPAPKPGRVDAGVWVLVISRSMGTTTLKQGSKGPDVTTLQRALRAAGATITVNGVFGAGTKKAVQRFQDANRIGADGIVGDETLFLLKSGATIG
jgi:peptidoglycan hydrolase-like protein with peptidoglycan-binding domain